MLAQYGYFYMQKYSNMNRQRDVDIEPNDKPYLKISPPPPPPQKKLK